MNGDMGGMTYARFFPSDWRTGCLVLNLEEEGLYIRCCAYMYDTGKAVPSDDQKAARILSVQPQKYVKVMNSLIEKGKMIRGQGYIINERVQEEIDKYRREYAARSAAATAREAARKKQMQLEITAAMKVKTAADTPPQHPPYQPPHLPGGGRLGGPPNNIGGVPPEVSTQKPSEINGTSTTAVPQGYHGSGTNPEARIQKLDEERKTPTTRVESDAARGGSGGEYLDSLNGSAVDLSAFIAKHARVDGETAQRMLTTNIKAFGAPAMLEAYSVTIAEMASGLVGAPYKYLIGAARGAKEKLARRPSSNEKPPAESRRDRLMRHVQDAAAKEARR